MKMHNKLFGVMGEAQATHYLKSKKYKIIKQNYVCPIGEIDIIAKDKTSFVFVEVKSRASNLFGQPAEAVGKNKQRKNKQVALYFLKENKALDAPCRFDVIEVVENEINHIINAF